MFRRYLRWSVCIVLPAVTATCGEQESSLVGPSRVSSEAVLDSETSPEFLTNQAAAQETFHPVPGADAVATQGMEQAMPQPVTNLPSSDAATALRNTPERSVTTEHESVLDRATTQAARNVSRVKITASKRTLKVGQSTTLTAVAHYSDGSKANVTPTWSSRHPKIATVSSSGRVTAVGAGKATIRASYGGKNPSVRITVRLTKVDPRFKDRFWRQLVYDQHDSPGSLSWRRSRVLSTTSPNFYIRTGNAIGRRAVSQAKLAHMRKAIPSLVRQLTGKAYRGRIEYGLRDWSGWGWITIRFVTAKEEPDIARGTCGVATVGGNPGNIWIIRRPGCLSDRQFPELFAHEFGHALGFFHLPGSGTVMCRSCWTGRQNFTLREQYHAQLAYEVGRGAPYKGWPLPVLGPQPDVNLGPPVIIVD